VLHCQRDERTGRVSIQRIEEVAEECHSRCAELLALVAWDVERRKQDPGVSDVVCRVAAGGVGSVDYHRAVLAQKHVQGMQVPVQQAVSVGPFDTCQPLRRGDFVKLRMQLRKQTAVSRDPLGVIGRPGEHAALGPDRVRRSRYLGPQRASDQSAPLEQFRIRTTHATARLAT
jgi:hypothetical protein